MKKLNPLKNKNGDYSLGRIILIVAMLVLVVSTLVLGVRPVPSNYVGVKTSWGQVVGEVDEGFHWVNVWLGEDIISVDGTMHNVTLSGLSCGTLSQQEVTTKATLIYRINTAYAQEVYRELRLDWEARVIITNIENSLKATTAQFQAPELLQKRETVVSQFRELLSSKLEPYHIVVVSVQLDDFQFTQEYYNQIEATNTAREKANQEKENLEIVRYQQEQEILKEQAKAQMMEIEAQAYANATITRAYADAEAVRIISEQMKVSPEYATYLYYQVWNGQLPYIVGSDVPFIIDLPQPSNSTSP